MKTATILLAAVTAAVSVPASACDPRTRALADEAHSLAAELSVATASYARWGGHWTCIATDAARADAAAEAVLCGLDSGDYCAAREAAEQLHGLAENLEDEIEDLDFRPGRWRGPRHFDCGSLAELAERLDHVTGDLCRAVIRLDQTAYAPAVPVGRPFCGTTVPRGPSNPYVLPGRPIPSYELYDDVAPRGGARFDEFGGDTLGPGLAVPPTSEPDLPAAGVQPSRDSFSVGRPYGSAGTYGRPGSFVNPPASTSIRHRGSSGPVLVAP